MLNLVVISVISEPTYCVLLNFLGKSQSAQDSQLFLHWAFTWFADASLDKLHLFPRTAGCLGRCRDCPLVPGDWAGDALPPLGGGGVGPPPNFPIMLLAMNTALADIIAGVHLRLSLSNKTRGDNSQSEFFIYLGTYCCGCFHFPGYLTFGTAPYCPSSSKG